MQPYSSQHRDYLIQSIPQQIPVAIQGALRIALQEGERETYLAVLKRLVGFCACKLCEAPTHHIGTDKCDACWELHSRIEASRFRRWSETADGHKALVELSGILEDIDLWSAASKETFHKPIVGQPVVTGDGFGKVVRWDYNPPGASITVRNDLDDVIKVWAPANVRFVQFQLVSFNRREL